MPGGNKKGGGLESSSVYKMKNSALYKSAKHGSPMQKNYDNTNPNKKDFVSTVVNKGITVPKKTTQKSLTKKQTGPLEGRESIPTWPKINTLDNKKGKTKKTVDPRRGKTEKRKPEQAPKRQMQPDSSPQKPESTTNSIKNKGIREVYKGLVPPAVQNLNKKILNFIKK